MKCLLFLTKAWKLVARQQVSTLALARTVTSQWRAYKSQCCLFLSGIHLVASSLVEASRALVRITQQARWFYASIHYTRNGKMWPPSLAAFLIGQAIRHLSFLAERQRQYLSSSSCKENYTNAISKFILLQWDQSPWYIFSQRKIKIYLYIFIFTVPNINRTDNYKIF